MMDQFAPKAEPQPDYLNSSRVESVVYDAEEQTLDVQFKRGGLYRYYNVPQATYSALLKAPSAGKYLDIFIKKTHPVEKL